MENSAFDRGLEKGELELKSVNIMESNNHSSPDKTEVGQPNACQPDICRKMHERYLVQKSKMADSPWHRLKTVFLVAIIALLILWAVVYAVCSRLDLI